MRSNTHTHTYINEISYQRDLVSISALDTCTHPLIYPPDLMNSQRIGENDYAFAHMVAHAVQRESEMDREATLFLEK